MISAYDVRCIYELPLVLNEQGLDAQICDALNILDGRAAFGRLALGGAATSSRRTARSRSVLSGNTSGSSRATRA